MKIIITEDRGNLFFNAPRFHIIKSFDFLSINGVNIVSIGLELKIIYKLKNAFKKKPKKTFADKVIEKTVKDINHEYTKDFHD